MRGRGAVLLVAAMMIALTGTGCKKKVPGPGDEVGGGALGLEESTVRGGGVGAGEGTLAAQQAGIAPGQMASGPLKDIQFDFDSFDLNETARQILQDNADWLLAHSQTRVELEGHCDDRGTVEYNLALGAKRAAAAKTYLVSLGVDDGRVTTISYGEELPLCTEKTESCWQRNRRDHFVVVGD